MCSVGGAKRAQRALVCLSSLRSIYQNLALEHWLFRFQNLTNTDVLLIWRDDPCVVIGRHQNPWLEANVQFLKDNGVALARRHSGGGAVYHDENNINCSFLTDRSRHCRERNLQFIASTLLNDFNVSVSINKKHDLILDGQYKVSGTAAKITSKAAYHHLTLLLSVAKNLHSALAPPSLLHAETHATRSVRSPVAGLLTKNSELFYENCVNSLVAQFLKHYASYEIVRVSAVSNENYSSIEEMVLELQSWDWVYGKTPKFVTTFGYYELHVDRGVVTDVVLNLSQGSFLPKRFGNALGKDFTLVLSLLECEQMSVKI